MLEDDDAIELDPNEWLYDDGTGALLEVGWLEVLEFADRNPKAKITHNATGIELTRAQARRFERMPTRLLVPHCPTCRAPMSLRGGRLGAFFYCRIHVENRKNGGSCVSSE